MTLNLEQIIEIANDKGLYAAEAETRESNGSEAWQAVQFKTKGNRKLQNELKKLEVQRDSYWGYYITAPFDNYFLEEAYNDAFVKSLAENGIAAVKVERLL